MIVLCVRAVWEGSCSAQNSKKVRVQRTNPSGVGSSGISHGRSSECVLRPGKRFLHLRSARSISPPLDRATCPSVSCSWPRPSHFSSIDRKWPVIAPPSEKHRNNGRVGLSPTGVEYLLRPQDQLLHQPAKLYTVHGPVTGLFVGASMQA